ncbi:hypothetical protein Afer_0141 [Acidimicrobium ferrooxidans DSM 10331]|uniref:Uncharacterized protein n=1 Tax=Acidimicrobium ferrooxidans (strain DSM 10331 / JCM 15462 / NBRC 103882 / ICP) TaxID=525909 RepID=C7M212_ACIFD|nr:hypothetical protein [Acidimicrobium ferrooxidans]ACU53110.1 hypothetical protein Afer_0141 [Acidimicrobium ferrooxidans DSM 10331]
MSEERRIRALGLLRRIERLERWKAVGAVAAAQRAWGSARADRIAHVAAIDQDLPLTLHAWHLQAAVWAGEQAVDAAARRATSERWLRASELRERSLARLEAEALRRRRSHLERARLADLLDRVVSTPRGDGP